MKIGQVVKFKPEAIERYKMPNIVKIINELQDQKMKITNTEQYGDETSVQINNSWWFNANELEIFE